MIEEINKAKDTLKRLTEEYEAKNSLVLKEKLGFWVSDEVPPYQRDGLKLNKELLWKLDSVTYIDYKPVYLNFRGYSSEGYLEESRTRIYSKNLVSL